MFSASKQQSLFDPYLLPNEELRWIGRPASLVRRERTIARALIASWFGCSAVTGIAVEANTFRGIGLGLLAFALMLIFLYILWTLARRNIVFTGIYYGLTNQRALILHVQSRDIRVEAAGLQAIDDIQMHPQERAATVHFLHGDDIRLSFDRVSDYETLLRISRAALTEASL